MSSDPALPPAARRGPGEWGMGSEGWGRLRGQETGGVLMGNKGKRQEERKCEKKRGKENEGKEGEGRRGKTDIGEKE